MPTPLLTVKNLAIRTATTPLVKNVSFTLERGKTLALVGESGSGKSLSALAIMGLLPQGLTATADELTFNGTNLLALTAAQRRRLRGKHMAMIFQEPATALNPVLTCGYQVEEAFIIHSRLGRAQRRRKVLDLFAQVQLPNPERIFNAYPHQISGGQRQRVMIAMALAHSPELLVADEPTTALDVTVQAEIIKLVKSLQKDIGMAMLWITHDFGVVKELTESSKSTAMDKGSATAAKAGASGHMVVMQSGKVVEAGPAKTILARPLQAYTKNLLAATLELNPKGIKRSGRKPNPILTAAGLAHTYPGQGGWLFGKKSGHPALQNVGFELRQGRTLGVVGESGSGKSTLARVLTRLIPAGEGGQIHFLGTDFLALKGEALRQSRRNMQMVFQDPATSLNPKLTIADSIAEGLRAHQAGTEKAIHAHVKTLLAEVGLPAEAACRLPHQFSGGQRQRIAIARALALQPKVVVADEPVSALDVSIQAQILKLFQKIQAEHGTSFILISHDLRVISHLADDVLVMQGGKVVEAGPTAQVFAKPRHAYTKKLLAAVI